MPVANPNESPEYRKARDELLDAEMALRDSIERVASMRRALPAGGEVAEDYVFQLLDGSGEIVESRMSDLFVGDKETLFVYSFMFGPAMENACPSCSSVIDALNGNARPIMDRINLAVVARSPIERLSAFAKLRGWNRIPMYSASGNSYARDYHAETPDGSQMPMANVFRRSGGVIRHCWGSELLYAPAAGDPRHVDLIWPLWNVLDMTPEGRGDYYPPL